MRRTASAFATVALLAAAPQARAADGYGAIGPRCMLDAVTEPTGDGDWWTGVVNAGPLVVTGGEPVTSAELVCTVQVNQWDHTGADAVSVRSSGAGVVTVLPTAVRYQASDDDSVVVCSALRVRTAQGETALYWDDYSGAWSTDPAVPCEWNPEVGGGGLCGGETLLDPCACPLLMKAFPPEGDITAPEPVGKLWDCPPYDVYDV